MMGFLMVLALSGCVSIVSSIKCYKCYLAEQPYYITHEPLVETCANFDYSNAFIVDCPDSTFCYKKTVKDVFYNTEYVREERGCASQLYRGQKFDEQLGWIIENQVITNAYQRGCKPVDSYGQRTLNVEECYCDNFDLCNGSRINVASFFLAITGFGFITYCF